MKINVNENYELYQIIKDFSSLLEIFREAFANALDSGAKKIFCRVYFNRTVFGDELIIDIWDDGDGLDENHIPNFLGVAMSTNITEDFMKVKGKYGNKGHGTKIYYNSKRVQIVSKKNGVEFGVNLEDAVKQLKESGQCQYSDILRGEELEMHLPEEFESGFFVRIVGPRHGSGKKSWAEIEHTNLRTYIMMKTVFGTIQTIFERELREKDIKLYLAGCGVDAFYGKYAEQEQTVDPLPKFEKIDGVIYEVISLGHYFPEERYTEESMRQYMEKMGLQKDFCTVYSRCFTERTILSNGTRCDVVLSFEGYETKRCYNLALNRKGKKDENNISQRDNEVYGIWACVDGVPIQRIDDWLNVSRGEGTLTYLHGYVNCDWDVTANRGAICAHNEFIEMVKEALNSIWESDEVKMIRDERQKFERQCEAEKTVERDNKDLKDRAKKVKNKKDIILPNGKILKSPAKLTKGYCEKELEILLVQIIESYPNLFDFEILDFNANRGLDSLVEVNGEYKYIEYKGTLGLELNHAFRKIDRIICYDIDLEDDDVVFDIERLTAKLYVYENDEFSSRDYHYKKKAYRSYRLRPDSAQIKDVEIVCLREILISVLGAEIK